MYSGFSGGAAGLGEKKTEQRWINIVILRQICLNVTWTAGKADCVPTGTVGRLRTAAYTLAALGVVSKAL